MGITSIFLVSSPVFNVAVPTQIIMSAYHDQMARNGQRGNQVLICQGIQNSFSKLIIYNLVWMFLKAQFHK